MSDDHQGLETVDSEWYVDQSAKSKLFHEQLHKWELLEVANAIETVRGDQLSWVLPELHISPEAWNKVIHSGVKPVQVFAHPNVLERLPGAVAYYRMLAMVSQKSMGRVGLPIARYEPPARALPPHDHAVSIAHHLNGIISVLIERDEAVDIRELDIWRGMAAGTQAQGSWQNVKGHGAEAGVRDLLRAQLRRIGREEGSRVVLDDGRICVFADEPDVAVYETEGGPILAAAEIKGGIDTAGVLERVGAATKSLGRIKEQHPTATTILLLRKASVTETARNHLQTISNVINYWFTIEEVVADPAKREELLRILIAR